MHKYENSEDLIRELKETGGYEILNNEETKEYQEIFNKYGVTKDLFIQELKNYGYSEFALGVVMGLMFAIENKTKT